MFGKLALVLNSVITRTRSLHSECAGKVQIIIIAVRHDDCRRRRRTLREYKVNLHRTVWKYRVERFSGKTGKNNCALWTIF